MRAAHIHNGKVANIVEVESLDFAGLHLVADTDLYGGVAKIGDKWAGGRFTTEAPDAQAAFAAQVQAYDAVVQARIDSVARSFGYGDPNQPEVSPILHAISYAEEPAVRKFQAEGRVLRAWRSHYWAACWPILEDVRAGRRAVPTPNALLVELDAIAPAPTAQDVADEIATML